MAVIDENVYSPRKSHWWTMTKESTKMNVLEPIARFTPKVIETEAEHDAAIAIAGALMEKGDQGRTHEEDVLLGLVSNLIAHYEDRIYEPIPDTPPVDALKALMEASELKAIDVTKILGGRSRVPEILAGKRVISKEQAKRLGERFHVSPALFL